MSPVLATSTPASGVPERSVVPLPLAINIEARLAEIDERRLASERLLRLQRELLLEGCSAALLFDPLNIRYATGTRNMAVWTLHAPGRYAFVPAEGPVILFEFESTLHLGRGVPTVHEVRPSTPWFYFLAGPRVPEKTALWAREIIDLMSQCGHVERTLAVDRCEPWGAQLLQEAGIRLLDAQPPIERARRVKTPDEIKCLQLSIDVADVAIQRMRQAVRPGLTENQLWGVLHETNIAHGGEWIECRLLTSGPRTNPWYQECSNRAIEAGDMVGLDTDMVGPCGYLADLSRSFVCPGRPATCEQRNLYELAHEQILTNIDLIKPGLSFREFSERSWNVPDRYVQNRYMMMIHGAGMVDEYPTIVATCDWDAWGYDDVFEENMVMCVESYIGEAGGREGVKLEQQVLVSEQGAAPMSKAPIFGALEIE